MRARLVLPVHDAEADFEWGVWVSLSEENYRRTADLWTSEGREAEPPYFAWLQSMLGPYPPTLSLQSWLYTQPVGMRPLVELQPTDHPLAREQREGIDMARVHELAAWALHGVGDVSGDREWEPDPVAERAWLERAAEAGSERARAELQG